MPPECTAPESGVQATRKNLRKRAGLERCSGIVSVEAREIHREANTGEETTMRIAYLTLDEVNQHLASAFADEYDLRLDVLARPGALGEREYDAVLYDRDSFPLCERLVNLTSILACPIDRPVAVHGYDFSADHLHLLRQRGAIVARRLGANVLARLIDAVRATERPDTAA
jgi:hypothetical protein